MVEGPDLWLIEVVIAEVRDSAYPTPLQGGDDLERQSTGRCIEHLAEDSRMRPVEALQQYSPRCLWLQRYHFASVYSFSGQRDAVTDRGNIRSEPTVQLAQRRETEPDDAHTRRPTLEL